MVQHLNTLSYRALHLLVTNQRAAIVRLIAVEAADNAANAYKKPFDMAINRLILRCSSLPTAYHLLLQAQGRVSPLFM